MKITDINSLAERLSSFLWNSRFYEHNADNIWFQYSYDFTAAVLNMLEITSENPYNNLTELLNEDLGIVLNSDDPADLSLRSVGLQLMQDVCDTFNILPERVFWVQQNYQGLEDRGTLMTAEEVAEILGVPDLERFDFDSLTDGVIIHELSANNTLYISELGTLDEVREKCFWQNYSISDSFATSSLYSDYPDFVDPMFRLDDFINGDIENQGYTRDDLNILNHSSHLTLKYASVLGNYSGDRTALHCELVPEKSYNNCKDDAMEYYLAFVDKDANNEPFEVPEYKF